MVKLLTLDSLRPWSWNPRKTMADGPLDDLTASIKAQGVLQPLLVRPRAKATDDHAYDIIAGHRRARAAQAAGLTDVPCLVRDLTDAEALELAITENGQRADVHPLEEAEAIERLMLLDKAYTVDAVAAKLGLSVGTVHRKLRLLKLSEPVRRAYLADAITAAHAERLAKIPADQQRAALEACFAPLAVRLAVDEAFDEDPDTRARAYDTSSYAEMLIEIGQAHRLKSALGPISDLDRWIERRARVDVQDQAVQADILRQLEDGEGLVPEGKTEDDMVQALVPLSQVPLSKADEASIGAVSVDRWKEIDGTPCKHAQGGVIVHGLGGLAPRVVSFCRKKSCAKHWPKAEPFATTREGQDAEKFRQEEQQRRDERQREQEAFAELEQAIKPAVIEHVKRKFTKLTGALAKEALGYMAEHVEDYGLKITDKTAIPALALALFATANHYNEHGLAAHLKLIGFDLKAWKKQQADAAKKAAKMPTKTKPAKKGRAA
jgi:ParB/RepB/Spo0J family partition protein